MLPHDPVVVRGVARALLNHLNVSEAWIWRANEEQVKQVHIMRRSKKNIQGYVPI